MTDNDHSHNNESITDSDFVDHWNKFAFEIYEYSKVSKSKVIKIPLVKFWSADIYAFLNKNKEKTFITALNKVTYKGIGDAIYTKMLDKPNNTWNLKHEFLIEEFEIEPND